MTAITAKNYFSQTDKFLSKLPSAAKEAHELVTSMHKDGVDDPFHTGDKDIDSMGELLLNEANKIIASGKSGGEPLPPKNMNKKPPVKKKTTKKSRTSKYGKTKITKLKSGAVRVALPKKAKKVKKTISVKKAKKHTQKAVARAVKQARKADVAKSPVTVKKLSLELQLIKSFLGMNGKTYSPHSILSKQKTIGKHLKEGHIVDHVSIIKKIHSNFTKMANAIKKEPTVKEIKVQITPGTAKEYKALIKDAKIRVRTEFLSGPQVKVVDVKNPIEELSWIERLIDKHTNDKLVGDLAKKFKSNKPETTLKRLHNYVAAINSADKIYPRTLKSPEKLLNDAKGGITSKMLLVGSVLNRLKIPFRFELAAFKKGIFQHIYAVATADGKEYILDTEMKQFNKLAPKIIETHKGKEFLSAVLAGGLKSNVKGVKKTNKIILTYLRVDSNTGNIIYRGTDRNNYVNIEGVIYDMTDEGEPLSPVHNVIIKKGEPVYDPKDRFAKRLTSKKV